MIKVENLTVTLGKTEILHGLNFEISDGDKVAIVGPNGSGKTTLIKAMMGVIRYSGSIYIDNRELKEIPRATIAKYISYVPQSFLTPYTFTVEEFVAMGKYIDVRNWWEVHDVDPFLKEVGVENLKNRYINTLSGGELQKVLIARALAQGSKLMFLDEPTSHLDPRAAIEINGIIKNLDRSIVAAIHDINSANRTFNKAIIMNKGRILGIFQTGTQEFIDAVSQVYSIKFRYVEGNLIPADLYFNIE